MESDEAGVLGPMLFLLFVMPPPLLSAGSFRSSILGWRNLNHHLSQDWEGFIQSARYQRSQTDPDNFRFCDGAFDLYFLVDTSDYVENNGKEIYKYMNEMVKKYTNPKLRMSFVTYSTSGQTIMELTSDRNKIQGGLTKLQKIVPSGDMNMLKGLKKVNEQIQQVYSRDKKAASLIVILTAGRLLPETIIETVNEAHKARKMGAKIYNVGLKGYSRKQLIQIIDTYNKMYETKDYSSMDDFVNSFVGNSCLDVMGKETYFVCLEEAYNLAFNTFTLQQDKLSEYVCRYTLDNTTVYTKQAISMTSDKLICSGHVFEKAGQEVVVEYSLNSGVKFQDRTLKVTSRSCGKTSIASPTTPPPATLSPATTLPAPPPAQPSAPPPAPPHLRPPTLPPTNPPVPSSPRPPTLPPTNPPVPSSPRPPTLPPTNPPVPSSPRPPTLPPTNPPVPSSPRPPTPPPIKPPVPPPQRPSTTPPARPTVLPPAQTLALPSPPMPSPQFTPIINNLYFIVLIPALLMFPLLIWCIWCCKRAIKKSPPVKDQEKKPKTCRIQTCPTVIVPCYGCQEDRIQRVEGKLDTLCDFVQNCNQVSLMWCQPRDKGKCFNVPLVKPYCAQMPCDPKICLAPCEECSPLNSCCSCGKHPPQIWSQPPPRMLPLMPPSARALCRTTPSLPPP